MDNENGSGENRTRLQTPLHHYDIYKGLHELFRKQASLFPDIPALIDDNETLTYRELDQLSDRIAHAIVRKGAYQGSFIGLCAGRSSVSVAGMLGILKAGCAWVPIDTSYPEERIGFIIRDASLSLIVTQHLFSERLSFCPSSLLLFTDEITSESPEGDTVAPVSRDAGETAYVIYTSGTTGYPKGVCCHHQGVVNLLDDFQQRRPLGHNDRCSWWTTASFDVSVYEIFSALLAGASLLIVPETVRSDSIAFMTWLRSNQITSAYLPPMMAGNFVEWIQEHAGMSPMRRLLTGVEPVPSKTLLNLQHTLPELTIINGYGPTETTICATLYTLDPDTLLHETVPIGRPVQNMHITLLDDNDNPVENGQIGEIHIGGIGVSRGYLNRPELNEQRFIPDPECPSQTSRMYRTGDLAFLLPDGNLVFAGRKDTQFKYMGFRIEAGEIEAVLKRHNLVSDVVVVLREEQAGSKKIVAYFVARAVGHVTPRELHALAAAALPEYMIPSAFVSLTAIPMTSNGKTDRKALPPPARDDYLISETSAHFTAPSTPLELELVSLFSEILGIESVSINDNFFFYGGHSLLATRLCSQIRSRWNVDIPLVFVFEHPTPKEIANEIIHKEQSNDISYSIPSTDQDRTVFPASLLQKGIWLFQQYQQEGTLFNIPVIVRFSGPLQKQLLKKSFDILIARHDSLRTTFMLEEELLVQRVQPFMHVTMTEDDLSDDPPDRQPEKLETIRNREGRFRFNAETGPLLKLHLVSISRNEFHLFLTFHHLIIDGWGASVLFRELAIAYEALISGKQPVFPLKTISYGDFSLWHSRRTETPLLKQQLQYWVEHLEGASFIQNIPYDFSKPSSYSFSGSRYRFSIPEEVISVINGYCIQNSCTLYMYLLTAFQILVRSWSGRDDIITGTTIANRNHPDTESLVGLMTNSLAIRTGFSANPGFSELLRQLRTTTLEAFNHQDIPFEMVVERVVQHREKGLHPVFQNLFILQNTPEPFYQAGDIDFTYEEMGNETAKLDILLNIEPGKGSLFCWIEYNTALFDHQTIERFAEDYRWIVSNAARDANSPVSTWKLPSIPDIACFAGKETPLTVTCCHHLFECQSKLTPDRIALCCNDRTLSYRELDAESDHLAHELSRLGVGSDIPVGLCVQRNENMIIGILGILKAGGCYVPLDSQYPEERLQYMMHDSGIRIAVTDTRSAHSISFDSAIRLLCVDAPDIAQTATGTSKPFPRTEAGQTAYIMYTSGTSGTPKGVMVPHRGVTNLAISAAENYGINERDRILQFFSMSFDGSVEEIFMTFAAGATIVMRTFDTAIAVPDFFSFIEKEKISVIDLPTAFWKELVHAVTANGTEIPTSLRMVIIGGEQASTSDYQKWKRACNGHVRLINTYGPTECSVVSLFCDPETVSIAYDENRGLPIGKPVYNTRLYIVDERLRQVPFGMPGELLIGGAGVSKGYINLPEHTSERFIDDCFEKQHPSGSLYRTGDRVRSLQDGNLQFLGRNDNQIKIRGFRIEPGEIESVLNQHEHIRQSVVVDLKNSQGQRTLAAYYVPSGTFASSADIRLYLARIVPEYMVPSWFIPIETIPRLPNGKLDRASLPLPESDRLAERTISATPPRNELEESLVEIWQEVLGVHPIGITDDFFEIGGHSLLAVRLCSQIQKKINCKVTLLELFQNLTIEKLARSISDRTSAEKSSAHESSTAVCIHEVNAQTPYPPLFFIHILGTGLKFCRPLVKHLSPELPVYGLSIHLLDEYPANGFTVEEVAAHYVREVKKIQPQGPYLLAGISFGGIIAFEMARILHRTDDDIRLIALMDTNLPGAFPVYSKQEKRNRHIEAFRKEGVSYLIAKSGEVLKYKWFGLIEQGHQLFTKIQLQLYARHFSSRRLPVFLMEYTANNQNHEALLHYQPHPFEGRITIFKSEERLGDDRYSIETQFGWLGIATAGVDVYHCPGDHFGMLSEPHVKTLAEKLMLSIDSTLNDAAPLSALSSDGVIIRPAEKADIELFRELSVRSSRESPDAFVATLEQLQNEPPEYWKQLLDFIVDSPLDRIVLAFSDRRCIGFSAARIDANDPNHAILRWMWIEPEFRGKGAGSRLIDAILEWALSRGVQNMELLVSENQIPAIKLYTSKGFTDTGEPGFLRPGSSLRTKKMVYTRIP
jgi:amino acid adenylation domain-containing protein